jgi:ligand-binding sensor domain-containing protein
LKRDIARIIRADVLQNPQAKSSNSGTVESRGNVNSIRIEPHVSSGSVAQSACTSALWRAIITLLIALSMSTVSSASPRPALKELFRTDWTSRDGAPSSISDVVQTADGYLWVGSDAGLYRFDGLHFEPFLSPDGKPLPTGPVFSLDVVRDGSLWVGWLMNGCITRIQGASVRSFCTESGLLSTTVNEVTQDGAGKMWAATARGPYVLDGDRWKPVGKELGYDGGIYVVVYADRQGNVWLADEKSVYLRSINDQSFHLLFPHRTIGSFAQERDGTVWGLDTHGEMVALSDRVFARRVWQLGIKALTYDLRFDERGDLWLASVGHGLIRVNNFQHGKAIDNQDLEELSLSKGGLTTDKVWKIRQNREGNMWAATSNGLSRFRVSTFSPVELSPSLADIGVFPTSDGQMYIAPRNQPLQRLPQPLAGSADSIPVGVSSVYREKDGVEWLGAMDKLWRHDKHGFVDVKRPMPRVEIQTMTSDGHGGLWVAAATSDGLFHYTNGQWIQATFLPGRSPFSSMLDSQGRVWFGYGRGDIIVLDVTGKKTVFSGSDTQMSGLTNVFLETGTDILVGGGNGLRLFRNGRFSTIQSKQPHRFAGISGLVLSGGGDLWINEARDVAVISARELAESEKDPHHEVQVRVFDPQDGLSGNATQSRPLPSATANGDGTIWFSLQNSVVRLDPSHLPQNTLSPPVHIESLTADDKTILNPNAPRVTPDPSTVRIAYSGLSLAIPERVNFRYKLEGVDQDWQDVGTRREAIYTKLSPWLLPISGDCSQ